MLRPGRSRPTDEPRAPCSAVVSPQGAITPLRVRSTEEGPCLEAIHLSRTPVKGRVHPGRFSTHVSPSNRCPRLGVRTMPRPSRVIHLALIHPSPHQYHFLARTLFLSDHPALRGSHDGYTVAHPRGFVEEAVPMGAEKGSSACLVHFVNQAMVIAFNSVAPSTQGQ